MNLESHNKPMRVFIFLHGADKKTFLSLNPKIEEPIICADSGIQLALELPYKPKKLVLVGDLDSVSKKQRDWCKRNKYSIEQHPIEKDFTDGELALREACKQYPQKYSKVVLGGVSSLMDHTLGNILSTIPLVEKGHRISFFIPYQTMYVVKSSQKINNCKGHTISIIPIMKTKVMKTKGLQWKLEKETIVPYKSRTLRNKAIEKSIEIKIKEGLILIIESWGH